MNSGVGPDEVRLHNLSSSSGDTHVLEADYPGCCGATIIYDFQPWTEERERVFKSTLEEYGANDEDGDHDSQNLIEVILAEYQLGQITDEGHERFEEVNSIWVDPGRSWLPALKRLGFKFAGRFRNSGHDSECFVFQLPIGAADVWHVPPEGWEE